MNDEVREEILFHIQSTFEQQVDEQPIFNHVKDKRRYYQLNSYGVTLKFDKETGDLI
jgi:hypothetical protein